MRDAAGLLAAALLLVAAAVAAAEPAATGPGAPPTPPAAPANVEGFLYTRPVQVPARGWVRVPLDLTALRHLAPEGSPGGGELRVVSPAGAEVASRITPDLASGERREVTVAELKAEEGGWSLLLDLGPNPPPHERLYFDLSRLTSAPAVRLEGSADGAAWEPLAVGDLFQIGSQGGLKRTSLVYAATDLRYLRLHWPRRAGFPEVRRVEVEIAPGPSLAVTTRDARCEHRPPALTICRLPLPAAGQILRRLTVNLGGEGSVGYRLYEPQDSRWRPVFEGTWQRSGREVPHALPFDPRPVAGDVLRLELAGAAAPPPLLKSFGVELAVETVLFYAEEPGSYTLAYGAATGVRAAAPSRPREPAEDVAWLTPGPEQEHLPPSLPAAATAPGNRLGDVRFEAAWKVAAPGAVPGGLVRLTVPPEVYLHARPDLADLRLSWQGRQIPYLRWTPPEPALVVEREGLKPFPMDRRERSNTSRVDLELPQAGLPVTQLLMTAPPSPLRRAVSVSYIEPQRPGVEGTERVAARTTWECMPQAPLPCRHLLALTGPAPLRLDLRFEDRDNPPLAGLGLALFRRGDVLVFAWPEKGDVRLLAGARGLPAPDYDLEALRDPLLASPWHAAEIDQKGQTPPGATRFSRWLMPLTLVVAGAFLLILLRRILAGA
ncbi:MAG TPA: DUF3999 family protein [Thermoanaerobaculia bacterium]|nr:DUF3999 family protein [Thermoanaerobaculia bacterium]